MALDIRGDKIFSFFEIIRPLNLSIILFSFFYIAFFFDMKTGEIFYLLLSEYIFIAASGYVLNDILDLKTDMINRPDRVLPSGKMSLKVANRYFLLLFFLSLFLNTFFPLKLFFFNLSVIFILLLYDLYLKKKGVWGNIAVAYLTITPFLAFSILTSNFEGVLPIIFFAFFLMLIREIVKDVEDMKGDAIIGSKSLPILLGRKKTILFLFILTMLYFFITIFQATFVSNKFLYFVFIILIVNGINFTAVVLLKTGRDRMASFLLKFNIFIGMVGLWLSK